MASIYIHILNTSLRFINKRSFPKQILGIWQTENLLKEAIADAKAVKETAIANAKLALEEAFTPSFNPCFC